MEAEEQRASIRQLITDEIAGRATRRCSSPGCVHQQTSSQFTRDIAVRLTPAADSWPPKFLSVHTIRSVLQTLVRIGEVSLDWNFDCKHTHGAQNYGRQYMEMSLRQLAAVIDVRAKGLCLNCASEGCSQAHCEHERFLAHLIALDSSGQEHIDAVSGYALECMNSSRT